MTDLPDWMHDCISYFLDTCGRLPTTSEYMLWKEAEASCRMEHE